MIKILISPLIALLISHSIKVFLRLRKNKKLSKYHLNKAGGMPSGHAATVSALTLSLYLYQGFNPLFIVTLIFSLTVLRDTFLRRKEVRHKLSEILVGIILGILISFLIYLI